MKEEKENVKLNDGFTQVCMWPATVIGDSPVEDFVKFFVDTFDGTRIQFLEEITTNPDISVSGVVVPGTGGRVDLLFAIHDQDQNKFATLRLKYGIRWLDDVYGNGQSYLYPERVKEYLSWESHYKLI